MKPRRRLDTARHEAAHAVLGEAFGRRVLRVCIGKARINGRRSDGHCVYDKRTRATGALCEAIATVAGSAAEQLWHRMPRHQVSRGDLKFVRAQGFSDDDIVEIVDLARVHVKLREVQVEAVARELLKRDLTGDDVRRIMRANVPPGFRRPRPDGRLDRPLGFKKERARR